MTGCFGNISAGFLGTSSGVEAGAAERGDELFETPLVLRAGAAGDIVVVECEGGGVLDGAELAAVAVVLHVGKGADDALMAADPADAPADHVVALAEGIDF